MSKIDWNKAPADAQGFMPYDGMWISGWWKDDGGSRYFWSMEEGDLGGWKKSYANPFERPGFIKRQSPAWIGEGLPPVGTVLEAIDKEFKGGTWTKVVVLAAGKHGNDDCLMVAEVIEGQSRPGAMVASLYTGWERSFRPIRTPEQIAADERDAMIEHMLRTYLDGAKDHRGGIRALYDAGYRKP